MQAIKKSRLQSGNSDKRQRKKFTLKIYHKERNLSNA